MSDPIEIIRAVVRDELRSLRLGDIGVVTAAKPHTSGDDHNYECNVRLRESPLELRDVPLATPHIGMASAPREGELVYIAYVGGDANHPIIVGRLYSAENNPPIHRADEWRVESPLAGETSLTLDAEGGVVLQAGDTRIHLRRSDHLEVEAAGDLRIDVQGSVDLRCTDCKISASGNVDLGEGGAGVITAASHKCYFTGAPLVGSLSVKAKG